MIDSKQAPHGEQDRAQEARYIVDETDDEIVDLGVAEAPRWLVEQAHLASFLTPKVLMLASGLDSRGLGRMVTTLRMKVTRWYTRVIQHVREM